MHNAELLVLSVIIILKTPRLGQRIFLKSESYPLGSTVSITQVRSGPIIYLEFRPVVALGGIRPLRHRQQLIPHQLVVRSDS